MQTYILSEGTLNDNELYLANEGKVFKGNYIAIIKEYKFLNSWGNSEHIKRFRTEAQLQKYLDKNYPDFEF